MAEQDSEKKSSASETFRELLLKRGSDAASRVVEARQISGMGDGTIDTETAIRYLRSTTSSEDKLSLEVDKSDQPDLIGLITDPTHAMIVTSPETPLDEHQAAIMDFNESSGVIRIWRYPGNKSAEDIAQLVTSVEPIQVEKIEESMLATRVYRGLESASTVYSEQ